ncbi:FecR domain-containing protein [Alphaproteobacteria bacterium]|nr:FecR domain-containing protein [Alphaproteobacteria bacterium]
MRSFIALAILSGSIGLAAEARTVSGVVAVSTGPMQAFTEAVGRNLIAGDDVFLNDEVETGKATRAQVLLRDESVFSLAPSSKVVFDEFVYDPVAEEGVLEASLLRGGIRFVSGQLAKNTPENIKIRAGKATVGIRGTEIIATHRDDGSTFVLLSGAMEVSTDAGIQLVDRPGFGIDVSANGLLGDVRQVPLAEINAILSPPPEAEEADSEGSNDDESEAEAGDEDGGDSAETEASDGTSEGETKTTEEGEGSFDSAVASAAGQNDDSSDISSVSVVDVPATVSMAPAVSQSEAVATVVDSLAEDSQVSVADNVGAGSIPLTLSKNSIPSNPYFSSDGKVLIRAGSYFVSTSHAQFGVTRDLLRETFPTAETGNIVSYDGFDHVDDVASANLDLDEYDAVLMYMDTNNALSTDEQTRLREFIHVDGKPAVVIGRQHGSTQVPINSALEIFDTGNDGEYRYSASKATNVTVNNYNSVHSAVLSPNEGSVSSLLDGVSSFIGSYDGDSGFPYLSISRSIINSETDEEITNDIINISDNTQGLEFDTKGAAFFSRFSCGYNNNKGLGQSVNFNSISTDRTQLCRNLFSSLAPATSLMDVEIGTLTPVDETGKASYTLTTHMDLFKIVGNKLLLRGGASPRESSYDLEINTLLADGKTGQSNVGVSIVYNAAQSRVVASREEIKISNGSTGSIASGVAIDTNGLQTVLKDADITHPDDIDISWISLGSPPPETGVLTLHYRQTIDGATYDRFHEVEVNYDCVSAHCTDFATSMDTQTELTYGKHFNNNDFGNWENDFFARFTSGEGRFTKTHNFTGGPDNIDTEIGSVGNPIYRARSGAYSHNLSINYGAKQGALNTAGAFDGSGEFDVDWSFDFLDTNICSANGSCVLKTLTCAPGNGVCNGGPDTGSIMASLSDEGFVAIGNIPLPNGKQSLAIKSYMVTSSRAHITDFEVMKPQ